MGTYTSLSAACEAHGGLWNLPGDTIVMHTDGSVTIPERG